MVLLECTRDYNEALLGGLYVPSLNFKHNSLPCPCQYFNPSLIMSLVATSSVLCRCFKAMSLVGVVPQEGLYNFIDQILEPNFICSVKIFVYYSY